MPPIQNQHVTPTALQNIQFFIHPLFLSLMEALQIQTSLCAEGTGAMALKPNKDGGMTIYCKGYWYENVWKMEAKLFFIKPDVVEEQIRF